MISSMSKIKKIKVTRKNCSEKGERPSSKPINPHSKGFRFIMLLILLYDMINLSPSNTTLITLVVTIVRKYNIITD